METPERIKCLIIGSGPAGYTSAIYLGRANLNPVLYQGIEPGGQLTTTTDIENFPGYPDGIGGLEMMEQFRTQAQKFGCDIRTGVVTSVDFSKMPLKVVVDNRAEIEADSVIIATGATARYLGLESENKFRGMGVSACATCDGFFYRNKNVAVVGGGDTACEEAVYLASLCKKVYIIVRKHYMRASKVMQERVDATSNIEVIYGYNTKEILGDENGVNGVSIIADDGSEVQLQIDGFFLAIGHHPNTEVFRNFVAVDEQGYIKTEPDSSKTNIQGVFTAGNVKDPKYRQAIVAAGSGCIAALDCERFLRGEI